MKKILGKKLMMLLALFVLVPIIWNFNTSTASAATPKFKKSKVELVGAGEVYQLEIANKVSGSKYKWTTSNKKVAKVSSKGVVTSVAGGSATIKCVITYPTKKTKTLSCKVTVTVPAEEVTITNVQEVNGAVIMTLGSTINFDHTIKPAKTTDKVYWFIGNNGDPSCISVDNPTEGIVTAKKVGKVTLKVAAAATASEAAAKKSIINDSIIIEVVGPTAEVQSAEIISTTELRVTFGSPINPNTVIGLNNKLTSNIEILQRKDTKGVLAADPGTLTGSLSSDGKVLTITSSATFGGEYRIVCSSNILTTSGVAIEEYSKALTFIDNYPPTYVGTTVDDTGFKATISFSEPMDFSNLSVAKPSVSDGSSNLSTTTNTILSNRLNYVATEDKKSLVIDLSNIATSDYGKTFTVVMAGLKDMAGNSPVNYTITVMVRTDNSQKPQAIPMVITRTGYNTLTATFTRGLSYAGYIQIKGGSLIPGVIDANDNKKVNYTISESDAALTGYNQVKALMWNSFNVIPTDTTAQSGREMTIDFSIDKSNPVLLSFDYDVANTTLTLTYNKEVTLTNSTGVFTTTLTTITDEIIPGSNVNYTNVPNTDKKILKLKLSNISVLGSYAIKLPYGFVSDNYKNVSLERNIMVSNTSGTSTELPAPYAILQNASNLNQISIEFANRLDVASAQNVANYTIPGVTIISAQVTKNTSSNGATVLLTLAENSIDITIERPVRISGVMGYNNSYTPIVGFSQMVLLKDNTKPRLVSNPMFDTVTKNVIKLNFNEQITGSLTVKVSLANNSLVILPQTVNVSGNTASIVLSSTVANGTSMKIEILNNGLVDASGNAAALDPAYFTAAVY
jgi:hypothetical protein